MAESRPMILLDRDGVLNRVVVDPEHGTIDSPLHPSQVEVYPWVADSIAALSDAGFGLAIVTNQPSVAKGKTTLTNLEAVHRAVLAEAQSKGGRILSSHICFHRSEDRCECRKPKVGLLREAFERNPGYTVAKSWMVGDGVTDVQAGARLGLRTAFLGARKCDACRIFEDAAVTPNFWGPSLKEFVEHALRA